MRLRIISMAVLILTPVAQERFVAPLPADNMLTIIRDREYRKSGDRSLRFDLYRGRSARNVPIVIFLNGIGADWMRTHFQYTSWARYVTTAGFAGIAMDSTEPSVATDFDRLLAYLQTHGPALGVDATRVIVWACSSNVRAAVPLVHGGARTAIVGAVFYYGAGETPSFRLDLPVLLVRAGADGPELNRNIDQLADKATAANSPFTLWNYPSGHHAFDIRDDNDLSRAVIRETLSFMTAAIDPATRAARARGIDLARASAAALARDWASAIQAYEALARLQPSDPEVQERLGDAFVGSGDPGRAISAYERALALGSPNRGILTLALVRTHTAAGNLDAAIQWLERLEPFMRLFGKELRESPDFAVLRADPRAQRIIR